MRFRIIGAKLLTNNPQCELLEADVRVENDRIREIGPALAPIKGEKVFDLSGQVLIPGFVQTHVHLCQTLFRNLADDLALLDWLSLRIWPMEGAHTAGSLRASAQLGILELLAGGTTCILDMGTVRHTEEIFFAAKDLGIRAFIGKCLMDRDTNPPSLRESTRHAIEETDQLARHWHGQEGGRLRYAPAPRFVLSCTESLLKDVQGLATQERLMIHTHASENRDEIAEVRRLTGKENIEYLNGIGLTNERLVLAHCVWLSDKEIKILRDSKTSVSHCPSSNLKLASGIAPVPRLLQEGVRVSLGADGAPCNNKLDMFQEMRLAALVQKPSNGPTAMNARQVFQMATLGGAQALGLGEEIGVIAPGFKADLVALDLNRPETFFDDRGSAENVYSAIVYASGPANVTHTWVDGRLVYQHSDFPGFDAKEITSRARVERRRLLDSLGQYR